MSSSAVDDGVVAAAASASSTTKEEQEKSVEKSPQLTSKARSDFLFLEEIGEGSYSTVYVGSERATHRRYAIKVCSKRQIAKEKKVGSVLYQCFSVNDAFSFQVQQIFREKECLTLLSKTENYHPFITRLYCTFQDEDSLYFVMTLASRKDLLQILKQRKKFSVDEARFAVSEIAVALGLCWIFLVCLKFRI